MDIDASTILEVVHRSLSPEQIEQSLIYWDKQVFEEGESIRIGPQPYVMPFDGTLVFVDLAPRFNWGHPCLYLLINVADLSTEVIDASFPPYSGVFPEPYVSLLRYGKAPLHERDFRIYEE